MLMGFDGRLKLRTDRNQENQECTFGQKFFQVPTDQTETTHSALQGHFSRGACHRSKQRQRTVHSGR